MGQIPGDQRLSGSKGREMSGLGPVVKVNLRESPVSWLHARGKLSDRQCAAGELLRRDYERAGLGARVTMIWDPSPPRERGTRAMPDPAAATHGQLEAKARFHAAMDEAGAGLSDILWRVVCAGGPVPEAERALGWPARSGRLVLSLALDRIARYYRVP